MMDVPDDIRTTARRIAFDLPSGVVIPYLDSAADLVAKAIMAEREHAAKIVETFWNHGGPSHKLVPKQAAAIRRGTP